MSSRSAQVSKTSKVQSLPDDLREIAEGLINDKFGKDVTRDSTPHPFHYMAYAIDPAYDGDIRATIHHAVGSNPQAVWEIKGTGVFERIDFDTRRLLISTPIRHPSAIDFRESVHRLDMANARRDGREATLDKSFARHLVSDRDFQMYVYFDESMHRGYSRQCIGQMFGVKIFVSPDGDNTIQVVQ